MPLTRDKLNRLVAIAWLVATVIFAIAFATLDYSTVTLFGLPWIVVLSIICQLSILGLFIFIAKTIWKIDEEGS